MAATAASCAERIAAGPAIVFLIALLLAGCGSEPERTAADAPFDFYVLALSWTPSYCAAEGESADRRQCGASAPERGFVVHGLWPQFEQGWPEFCEPGNKEWVPDELVDVMLDIMPSPGLIGHQWRRHGSCSGLSQEDYLALTRLAFEQIALPPPAPSSETIVPAEFEQAVIDANPGLDSTGMAIVCDDRFLREIRICMSHDLEFRGCPEVADRACRLPQALMPVIAD